MELFDSTKTRLYDLLKEVQNGKIQLPDFQRGWIWDDYRIKSLLSSVAKSFPIGAIMLLEMGNDNVKFKTRLVESVDPDRAINRPEKLILDGQQRITSLFQTIISNKVVSTRNEKGHEIKRWYYIDMQKALDGNADLDEAIISLNEKKQITRDFGREVLLDLSSEEKEYENLMYPICMIDEYAEWRTQFNKFWNYDAQKIKFWDDFEIKIINSFNHYQLPIIQLKKENTKEAVCLVFEKVNTGGVSLNVFELLTATFASDSFDLRENWMGIKSELFRYPVLRKTENTDFLQAVTLLSTYFHRMAQKKANISEERLPAVSCKRKDVLNLTLDQYQKHFHTVKEGFIKAGKLMTEDYIFKDRDLPYTSQIVPLSAICAILGREVDNLMVKKKLMQWYWCGVFGELYGGANETRYAADVVQVVDWIKNGIDNPKTVYDANFNPSRLYTLRTRNSAAYKGVYALLLKNGARDFIDGKRIDITTYYQEYIDIHHIFPKNYCQKMNIPRSEFDSIVNKTPLSYKTNRIIGGEAPSKYLENLEKKQGFAKNEINELLSSHLIDSDAVYQDDFNTFFEKRKNALLKSIEEMMGKTIDRSTVLPEPESMDFEDEDAEESYLIETGVA